MTRFTLVAFLLFLFGCNDGQFTTAKLDALDAADAATGGVTSTDIDAGNSGVLVATGGAGGVSGTGGAPEVDAGNVVTGGASPVEAGVPATGGAPATGGTPSTGGLPGTGGGGCTLVTHDNGLGQHWQDCVPLGTYDEEQAMKACQASDAAQCVDVSGCGAATVRGCMEIPCGSVDDAFWGYSGQAAGYVGASCPSAGNPLSKPWG